MTSRYRTTLDDKNASRRWRKQLCAYCKQPFLGRGGTVAYCSVQCSAQARKERHLAKQRAAAKRGVHRQEATLNAARTGKKRPLGSPLVRFASGLGRWLDGAGISLRQASGHCSTMKPERMRVHRDRVAVLAERPPPSVKRAQPRSPSSPFSSFSASTFFMNFSNSFRASGPARSSSLSTISDSVFRPLKSPGWPISTR
jgi:hypothetical protein